MCKREDLRILYVQKEQLERDLKAKRALLKRKDLRPKTRSSLKKEVQELEVSVWRLENKIEGNEYRQELAEASRDSLFFGQYPK